MIVMMDALVHTTNLQFFQKFLHKESGAAGNVWIDDSWTVYLYSTKTPAFVGSNRSTIRENALTWPIREIQEVFSLVFSPLFSSPAHVRIFEQPYSNSPSPELMPQLIATELVDGELVIVYVLVNCRGSEY